MTILCDYGTRYQSKLFNPAFLRAKGLPVPEWLERGARRHPRCVGELTRARRRERRSAAGVLALAALLVARARRRARSRSDDAAAGRRSGTPSPTRSRRGSRTPDTTTPELEVLRERLVRQRSEALEAEQALQPAVDELNSG